MQWVDTDENTHLRGDNVYVHGLAKHKAQFLKSPVAHTISRTDTSKDKKLAESHCTIFRKERLRLEQSWLRFFLFKVQVAQELES